MDHSERELGINVSQLLLKSTMSILTSWSSVGTSSNICSLNAKATVVGDVFCFF